VSEHPNAAAARRAFAAFVAGDLQAMLGMFTPDATWRVPGANAMAGEYRGRDEIVAFLRRTAEVTRGTYRVDLLWAVADDAHTVAVYRARGERDGRAPLDIEQALLVELRDGLWTDIRAQPLDQPAFDAFWA
jgi:uncharacterized protein